MKYTTITLKISGMHCTSCAINIDFELEDIDGVQDARTDYARQTSVITFDEQKVKPDQMIAVITKLGYEAVTQK
ncbi:MAG: cation transporter [Patescibacteria group bacterium]